MQMLNFRQKVKNKSEMLCASPVLTVEALHVACTREQRLRHPRGSALAKNVGPVIPITTRLKGRHD